MNLIARALQDRYEIEREIGHGGMATVYSARDLKHGRTVAIKVLRPELAQAVGSERFLREINIAAKLQSPHILPLLESGEAEGLLYYIMPFVDGESLRGVLAARGKLPASEAMRILRDIADGLAHAHRHRVVHRDVKPDNVMLADRHAVLVDFGVAKALSDATNQHDLTSIGFSVGTPAYMAPEQAAADPQIDTRADVYSVGVLAYEMLSGRPPFAGTPQAVLSAQIATLPVPLLDVQPDVPPAVAQIVMRCLDKDPAARYQDAGELLNAVESLVTPANVVSPRSEALRRRRSWGLGLTAAAAVAAMAFVATGELRRERWVHMTAIPELRRLIDAAELDSAFLLGQSIERIAPNDSLFGILRSQFTRIDSVHSVPAGARVYRASYPDTSVWHLVGTTPIDSVALPASSGLFRYELPGYRTAYRLFTHQRPWGPGTTRVYLDSLGSPAQDEVHIGGGTFGVFLVGAEAASPLELGDYRMDRVEITNRQFKAFVDAGGYSTREFWEHPFEDGGTFLTWEKATARFVDRSGQPGPATWIGGSFPDGQGDLPVGGVSWYEAAAYAKFAGKQLPTIYHWSQAASVFLSKYMVPASNLDGRGPLPAGADRGIGMSGVSDLAGNVREWCVNNAGDGQRFILGGGWTDPTYAFVDAYAQRAMDRSAINGIRLVRYAADERNLSLASRPFRSAFTDYNKVTPVSDAVYSGFNPFFEYDQLPLDSKLELRDTTHESWVVERVSFSAAYGGERMFAWVFLPRNGTPPYSATVVFPGSGVIGARHSTEIRSFLERPVSFIAKNRRVYVIPILKSTFERSDSLRSDIPDQSIFWRDHVVMWVKDFRRTLDYLSSRPDMDSTKYSYFGFSWGGYMGGIIPAVEPRIKASVLYVAGLTMARGRPEVDPVNHLPRIRTPVLMLNGRHDFFFPTETAQKPFFRLLGTPAEHKRYIVYEGGHDVPETQLIAETLAWLDKYVGPVR